MRVIAVAPLLRVWIGVDEVEEDVGVGAGDGSGDEAVVVQTCPQAGVDGPKEVVEAVAVSP